MRLTGTAVLTAAVTVATAAAVMTGPAANASHGATKAQAGGSCSQGAVWKLKAKPDDGRIEVGFEVDSNVNGQRWAVRIRDNGALVFSGARRTHAPSGSFTVDRLVRNRAGSDAFVARAHNRRTGETCVGRVTL